jgi:restriction system protein
MLFLIIFAPIGYVAEYVGWTMTLLLVAAVVALTAWFIVRRVKLRSPKAQELFAKLENVGSMSGGQFEVFVAEVLRTLGYRAQVLGRSGDQGVDIVAIASDGKVAIQCKNYKKRIGNKPVQEVYAGARHHNCDNAWVVAPAGYTKGAIELARSVGVRLCDAQAIKEWIREIDKAEQASNHSEGQPSPASGPVGRGDDGGGDDGRSPGVRPGKV